MSSAFMRLGGGGGPLTPCIRPPRGGAWMWFCGGWVGKVVDVVRAEIGRNGLVDVLKGDAERAGLFAVDHQIDLRRRRQALDIDFLQHTAGIGFRDQLIGGGAQRRIALLAAVLQPEREAARIAEIVDRRRLQRRNLGVADRREVAGYGGDACGGGSPGSPSL